MHENNIAFETGHGWTLTDTRSPDIAMMEQEEVEQAEEITVDGIQGIPRDALRRLILFLIPERSISPTKKWRQAQIRLALIAAILNVDGVGGQSLESLGKELGCTKALLSLYSLKMVDSLGLNKAPSGKARSAREAYSAAAKAAFERNGHGSRFGTGDPAKAEQRLARKAARLAMETQDV